MYQEQAALAEKSADNSNKSLQSNKGVNDPEKIEEKTPSNVSAHPNNNVEVSKFKWNNANSNLNGLLNPSNVENMTKNQLDQIKEIVNNLQKEYKK